MQATVKYMHREELQQMALASRRTKPALDTHRYRELY